MRLLALPFLALLAVSTKSEGQTTAFYFITNL